MAREGAVSSPGRDIEMAIRGYRAAVLRICGGLVWFGGGHYPEWS